MSTTHVPVVGTFTYRDADSTPAKGERIFFVPRSEARTDDDTVRLPLSLAVTLDANGSVPAGFTLPTLPDGVYYEVREEFSGGRSAYTIQILPTDTQVDLATVAPVVPEDPRVSYLTAGDIGVTVASQAQGAKADTALQPEDGLSALDSAAATKLGGIAAGATANATDAQLRDRATHTGTQPSTTITGLGDAATRNVGTTAGTVAAGDDARLSDARTPLAHTHPSTAINDSTATGRAVLTAADAAAAQTAIGIRDNTNFKMGFQAVNSLTTGLENYGFGYRALYSNKTGQYNSSFGSYSTYSLINGNYNYAAGYYALHSLAGGSGNTAINTQALYNLATGNFNVAMGYYAGMYYGSGSDPLTSASYGIFLGYDCRASANGNFAETVIGRNAIGNGSNTTTIGGASHKSLHVSGVIVPTGYTVAALPLAPPTGAISYASNGRKSGEGAGAGTGVPVYYSAGKWRVYRDDSEVLA